jgi:hypothetical protein
MLPTTLLSHAQRDGSEAIRRLRAESSRPQVFHATHHSSNGGTDLFLQIYTGTTPFIMLTEQHDGKKVSLLNFSYSNDLKKAILATVWDSSSGAADSSFFTIRSSSIYGQLIRGLLAKPEAEEE